MANFDYVGSVEEGDYSPDWEPATATERLRVLAETLYGPEWAASLSNLSGVNLRTCQRLQAAAKGGTEHSAAEGVIQAVEAALGTALLAVRPRPTFGYMVDFIPTPDEERRAEWDRLWPKGRHKDTPPMPVMDAGTMGQIRFIASAREQALCALWSAAMGVTKSPHAITASDWERFGYAMGLAAEALNGLAGTDEEGQWQIIRRPEPLFSGDWDDGDQPLQWGDVIEPETTNPVCLLIKNYDLDWEEVKLSEQQSPDLTRCFGARDWEEAKLRVQQSPYVTRCFGEFAFLAGYGYGGREDVFVVSVDAAHTKEFQSEFADLGNAIRWDMGIYKPTLPGVRVVS